MSTQAMNERVRNNLLVAVRTMREACDDAERRIESGAEGEVANVLHAFALGFANASSSIERAMAAVEDSHNIALMAAHLD